MRITPDQMPVAEPGLVSIVLPCYNSQRYLEQTLDSVQAQTYSNWELIAVNDGSTDETSAILDQYAILDPRIRVVHHRSGSGSPAVPRNAALRLAQGEFIAFVDSDDLYLAERLERCIEALRACPDCVAVFHDLEYIDGNGLHLGRRYIPDFTKDASDYLDERGGYIRTSDRFPVFQTLRYSAMQTSACMIARSRLPDGLITFDQSYVIGEDKDLWIRVALHGQMLFVPQVMTRYRLHDSNITKNKLQTHLDLARFFEMNVARVALRATPDERRSLWNQITNAHADLAWDLRRAGRYKESWRSARRAFSISPSISNTIAMVKTLIAWAFRFGRHHR